MEKYFLDYRGGLKGDFFANYFNYNKLFIEGNYCRSLSVGINFKFLETFTNLSENFQKNIIDSEQKIIPGHYLYKLDNTFLEKTKRKILKINIEKQFYKTAAIEWLIKHLLQIPKNLEKMQQLTKEEYFTFGKDVYYRIDVELIKENIQLTDSNRFHFLQKNLSKMLEYKCLTYDNINLNYENVHKNLFYGDIFINQKYDCIYELFSNFDSKNYDELLKKTWLPDITNVFGYDLDLRKYGYNDY
ncbi:MAG: hypothetical protein RLZZ44_948 [Bacteroidota bacterium]|jgi:hypothetical protein